MEINLYPCFKHWFYNSRVSKNSIWLFSDPHFADKESQFFRKNYIGDDELVKRINSKICINFFYKISIYKRDYINTENFKKAKVRLNYVLLKNKKFEDCLEEIKQYIEKYPNIETVSLKTLNLNTRNDEINNPYSKWIIENALTKKDTNDIINFMSNNAKFVVSDEKFFDRFEWVYEGVPITFYAKKLDYGFSNIVYYGGELVDYHLNKIEIKREI